MPRPDKGWGGSRDWYMRGIPCRCLDCHCNSGDGYCAVPTKISLDSMGRCDESKRLED